MQLVSIQKTQIGESPVNAVDTKELYSALSEDQSHYARWVKTNLVDSGFFKEGIDYSLATMAKTPTDGRPSQTYIVTLDTAKHLCMLARTQKAHEVREYFIECEKRLNAYKIPQTYAEALLEAGRLALENEKLIAKAKEDAPKVQCFNELMDSKNAIDFMTFSKVIGIGRTTLFQRCRDLGILMQDNIPFQRFIDNGYFRVIEATYTQGDTRKSYTKTMILPKGQDYLSKKLKAPK